MDTLVPNLGNWRILSLIMGFPLVFFNYLDDWDYRPLLNEV